VVIRVGDAAVTVQEFSDRLNLLPHPGQYRDSVDVKEALAASIVAEKILADEARRLRLDTLQEARMTIIQAEREAVYEQWMNQEIVQQVLVTKKALQGAFRRFREQRLVEFVEFDDSSSAVALRRAAGQGEAFAKVAARLGRPVETKALEYAEALPEVEDVVYSLRPGRLSDVVKVDGTYYLFRLKEVRPHPRFGTGSLSYWREAVERRVRARLVARRFDSVVPSLLRDKSFEIKRKVYEYVVDEIARRLPFQNAETPRMPEVINREFADVPENLERRFDEVFLRFSDGTIWTIGDIWSRLRYGPYLLNYSSEQQFRAGFERLIRQMVVFEAVVERGYREGLQNSPYARKETRMWRDDLLSRLFQAAIDDTVQVSDAEMDHPSDEGRERVARDVRRARTREALNAILDRRAPQYHVSIRPDLLSGVEVLEGSLMTRKSHFPNRLAVPLTIPFDPGASWFRKILQDL
jgi:hypothetical protein